MLTTSEISHIAQLAKLSLSAEERDALRSDLSRVLDYIALLEGFDVEGVDERVPACSAGRADLVGTSLQPEVFLDNAPKSLDRFLLVPAIK